VPIDSQFLSTPGSAAANPAVLSATFASLFPLGVAAAELRVPGDASLLWPEEAASVANAVPKRMQEFAAGRLCARRALKEFGITDFPVRVAHDRQPVWPRALTGSITHTAGLCAAVVTERTRMMALGVDTEVAGAAKPELWSMICAPAEMVWLDTLPRADQAAAVTLIFSAKEAFYKCQYPMAGEWLNFHDLCIAPLEWGEPQGNFAVQATRPIAFFNRRAASLLAAPAIECSYRFHDGFVSAGVCLPAPEETSAQGARS
jgi:4'-phosphopantetheinyl transferase EntD